MALLKSDILSELNDGKVIALILFDLYAAFDTIDHTLPLGRLDDWFGVTMKPLDWLKSYLTGKCQRIALASKVFTLYTTPLSSVISGHAIPHHLYTIDGLLYV